MQHVQFFRFCFLFALAAPALAAESDELRSTLQDQQNVAVTIYNDNLALVKDQRKIQLKSGQTTLAFRDVSAQIRPETAVLRSLSNPGKLSVIEQNFNFDLLTQQSLLEKYVGKTIELVRTNAATGVETREQAQVLSASSRDAQSDTVADAIREVAGNNGVVFKIGDRIETSIPGRLVYPDVPSNLRDRPTLVMMLNNNGAATQDVELSYLTGGLGWKADFVVELNGADDKLDLSGWVTLTNLSGASYRKAKLQLVAGNVNQVRSDSRVEPRAYAMASMAPIPPAPPMEEEALMEFHLYTLDHPTTLEEKQTKQVSLLSAVNVPVRKELLLVGAPQFYRSNYSNIEQKMKVAAYLEFDNKESAHLGMPLPKGTIRVYKKDNAGNAQFVGEDSIEHTPKNGSVRLKLGDSFDVTAKKKQTDFKQLPEPSKGVSLYESAYEIVLSNAKKEAVTVTVQEPIPGDWKMQKESARHEKANSQTAVWKITVPAEGSSTLSYRVQVRY